MSLRRLAKRLLLAAPAVVCVGLFLLALPMLHPDVNHPTARLMKSAPAQGSMHFAIADFDGDLRPDLAMIRVSREGAPDAQYSLELQFSSGKRPPIGLIGPAGGLEVSSQDVNGDQIADLVITSVVDSEFVAILLNDGKGNFTQVDRAEYPGVGKRPSSRYLAPSESGLYELAVSRSRWQFGAEPRPAFGQHCNETSAVLSEGLEKPARYSAFLLRSGRAPPRAS
jgi:hypothetical protein